MSISAVEKVIAEDPRDSRFPISAGSRKISDLHHTVAVDVIEAAHTVNRIEDDLREKGRPA